MFFFGLEVLVAHHDWDDVSADPVVQRLAILFLQQGFPVRIGFKGIVIGAQQGDALAVNGTTQAGGLDEASNEP